MIVHGNIIEFAAEFQEHLHSHGMKIQPATFENWKPDLVEIRCKNLAGVIRAVEFTIIENLIWVVDVLLSACTWSLHSKASIVPNHSLGELFFKRDVVMSAVIEMT